MDLIEFIKAYREECAREDAEDPRPIPTYQLVKRNDVEWRMKAEMRWADELDKDIDYPED